MGTRAFDVGLSVDLQDHLGKLAELLGANVPETVHALIRRALEGLKQDALENSREFSVEAKAWWKDTRGYGVRPSK